MRMTEVDPASDSQIPDWVHIYVRYQRRLIHPPRGDIDWDYFERLNKKVAQIIQRVDSAVARELAEKARPLNLQKLRFIPVYSLDRRSQWVRNIGGGTDE